MKLLLHRLPAIIKRFIVMGVALSLTSCATSPQLTAPQLTSPLLKKSATLTLDNIDATVNAAMSGTGAKGLGVAVIDNGQVVFTKAYGVKNAANEPLDIDTVMYGASLTKSAFAYLVMQLVDEGRLELDKSIAEYLPMPLPSYSSDADARAYAPWSHLLGDERWRNITPRILLTHSAGFANFHFVEPDGKLRIHFAPGERYAYSGAGIMLMQFVLERGLGIDVGLEMQRRIFDPNGMTRTSLKWRADFRPNLADGFDKDGKPVPHDERSRVRTAGSMDTTIGDIAKFAASYVRGDKLRPTAHAEMVRPQLAIKTSTQFPSLQAPLTPQPFATLSAALGVVAFSGPEGAAFFKGGHNDSTGNTWVCVEAHKRCVVLLSNDVRAEPAFPAIVRSILGETGVPWRWEYGEVKFWEAASK
jgi:CubicO group peptidase (beta-lactamase class C family)